MDPLLNGLTEAQREAVTHFEGPLLILAGPGSGKTRVVTHRVAWLLEQGIPGQHILALTFTNKAADEMSHRIAHLGGDPSVWVGTFHRFCARLLRKYAPLVGLQENYTIYDVGDSLTGPSPGSRAAENRRRPLSARKPGQGYQLGKEQSDPARPVPAAAGTRHRQRGSGRLPRLPAPAGGLECGRLR